MSNLGTPRIVVAGFGSGADLVRRLARSRDCGSAICIDHRSCVISIDDGAPLGMHAPDCMGELPELLGSAAVVFMISDGKELMRTLRLAARMAEACDVAVITFPIGDGDDQSSSQNNLGLLDSCARGGGWICGRAPAVVVDAPSEPDDAERHVAKIIRCISSMLLEPSIINLDLADLRTIMSCGSEAFIVSGNGGSPELAMRDALDKSLGVIDTRRARGCLLHITGGANLTLRDANFIAESMTGALDPHANVIWGMRVRGDLEMVEVTAVLTGENIKLQNSRNIFRT